MKIERGYENQSFRRTWVLANVVGLGVGMALFATVAEGVERSGIVGSPESGDIVGHLIGLPLAGVLFGFMQWLVLRRYITLSGWSALAAGAGLAVGYIMGYVLGGPPFDFILAPTLAGLFIGFAQWLVLRQRAERAGLWVLVSTVGFAFGGIVGTAVAILGLGDALGGSYLAWIALNGVVYAVAGAVGALLTGGMLMRLLGISALTPAAVSPTVTAR